MQSTPLRLVVPPAISGLLLFLSFPTPGKEYLAWIAFVPLLVATIADRSVVHALFAGAVSGAARYITVLIWIPPVLVRYGEVGRPLSWLMFMFLVLMQASFTVAACGLLRALMNRGGERLLLAFPLLWVSLEYASDYVFFGGFPWLLAGYSQTDCSTLVQVADVTGVYGVSFLVAAVNTGIAWLWLRRTRLRTAGALWPLLAALVLVAAAAGYGRAALRRWDRLAPDRRVALLQANISVDEPEGGLRQRFIQVYPRMAAQLQGSFDLIVLPESPSPVTFQDDPEYRSTMLRLAARFPLGIVFNNVARADLDQGARYYNSAYFVSSDGREVARYDKIHLVPFGEYVPLRKAFFFAESITKDVSDFHPGSGYVTAPLDGHPANAIICFESVFPELSRNFVRHGSQLILNLTNDAWYGATAAPYQHLAIARWRAVENRRYLLRAANSGISAVIEPTGRIQASTRLLREDICQGRFAFVQAQSIYTRYGDWFSIACVIIMGLLMFCCFGLKRTQAGRLK